MSGVKRFEAHYLTEGVMAGKALARAEMVLASDYDRDMIRISELHENAHAVAKATMAANADLQINFDTVKAERDELRAQVEAMRSLLGECRDFTDTLQWPQRLRDKIDAALREDKT